MYRYADTLLRSTLWSAVFVSVSSVSAFAQLPVADAFSRISQQQVTGATVITHGFQPLDTFGNSLMPLAQALPTASYLLTVRLGNPDMSCCFGTGRRKVTIRMVAGSIL